MAHGFGAASLAFRLKSILVDIIYISDNNARVMAWVLNVVNWLFGRSIFMHG